MNIVFEKVRWFDLPFIHYHLKKGHSVYFFDFNLVARKNKRLRELLDSERISRVAPFASAKNNTMALDAVEKVYDACFKQSQFIRSCTALYRDADIALAYKKVVIEQLSNFYAVQLFIKEQLLQRSGSRQVCLVPENYILLREILKVSSAEVFDFAGVTILRWPRLLRVVNSVIVRMRDFLVFNLCSACAIAVTLYKLILSFFVRSGVQHYQYAIAIRNPAFQFRSSRNRTFDFLLDGLRINKRNACFVFLAPVVQTTRARLHKEGYNCIDARPLSIYADPKLLLGRRASLKAALSILRYALVNTFGPLYENRFLAVPSCVLLADYLSWNIVMSNRRFGNFITFNDEGMRHIARNIVFRHHACKTWLYAHSSSFGCICTSEDGRMREHCHWLWAYLVYDVYVAWNQRMIDYQKLHRQKIARYVNIGCIWSTLISTSSGIENAGAFLKGFGGNGRDLTPGAKVIAVFDTSFIDGIGSEYPMSDGIRFYNDMFRLLEENGQFFMVIKEKKPSRLYAKIDFLIYTERHGEFTALLQRFSQHPRALVAGSDADPSELIKASDLVITCAFSSSTPEALGARKKAIFYDPADRFRGYYYDQVPGLVAHGYTELKWLIKKLLYETSETEYSVYLDTEMRGKVDDYLDGKGLFRFRSLLAGGAEILDGQRDVSRIDHG